MIVVTCLGNVDFRTPLPGTSLRNVAGAPETHTILTSGKRFCGSALYTMTLPTAGRGTRKRSRNRLVLASSRSGGGFQSERI